MRSLALAALPTLLACNDGKDGTDTGFKPAEITTTSCSDELEDQTVAVGATDVDALCLQFKLEEQGVITDLLIRSTNAADMVFDRSAQLMNDNGDVLAGPVNCEPTGECVFRGIDIEMPAGEDYPVWFNLADVGSVATTYQALLASPDDMITDPAGLQPGGTFPYVGPTITIE